MKNLLKIWREGAEVERAHTVPHIGSYTVGQHSHGVAMIILLMHPDPSKALVKAALLHDIHEVHTGDIPSFVKNNEFRTMEHQVSETIGTLVDLNEEDSDWLSAADHLELLLWCRDQTGLGNAQVLRIHGNLTKWFMDNEAWIPEPIIEAAGNYNSKRTLPIGADE